MKRFRVIYTTYLDIDTDTEQEALDIAAEDFNFNDFNFLDAEVEEIMLLEEEE